ncbi:MAG: hypothetical protein RLZZ419_1800, partial [Pseudomonadota bacterium]
MSEQELSTVTSAKDIIFSPTAMQQLSQIANLMASAVCTVPKHLQGNQGDCFAIAMQASQWGMSPFSVAQKTHLVNGVLGFEAQLINAVIQSSGAIKGRFHYEYAGENNKLSCRVGALIKGENDITWGEWLCIDSIATKNSPLWKTNPKQQFGYLQVKNWSRQYCPGAILGVYSDDELETVPVEKEINPSRKSESNNDISSIDKLLFSIRTMTIEDFGTVDPSSFTADERLIIRKAMATRKKEITDNQQANVVADVVAEKVVNSDWEQQI